MLKFVFTPLYLMAAIWDWRFSRNNTNMPVLSFKDAWEKQTGVQKEVTITMPADVLEPSANWQQIHSIYRIQRFKEKCDVTPHESEALSALQTELCSIDPLTKELNHNIIAAIIKKSETSKQDPTFNQHRFFNPGQPKISDFLDHELPERIRLGASR